MIILLPITLRILISQTVQVEHLEPWERGSRKTHGQVGMCGGCLLYTSPSPRDKRQSRMPSSA